MKHCKVYKKKLRLERWINNARDVFCSGDFEDFEDELDNFDYPYIGKTPLLYSEILNTHKYFL